MLGLLQILLCAGRKPRKRSQTPPGLLQVQVRQDQGLPARQPGRGRGKPPQASWELGLQLAALTAGPGVS